MFYNMFFLFVKIIFIFKNFMYFCKVNYKVKYYQRHNLDKCDLLFCANCGAVAVNLHHVIYKSRGGSDAPTNLIPLCYNCHASHHNNNNPTTEQLKELLKKKY